MLLPMPLPMYVVASIVTCTKPPTSRAKEDTGLKSQSVTVPYMLGARTMARCAIGVVGPGTTLRTVTASDIAIIAHVTAMMELTAFALTTFATKTKIARSTLLTPTSSVAIAPPSTTTLTSKGC